MIHGERTGRTGWYSGHEVTSRERSLLYAEAAEHIGGVAIRVVENEGDTFPIRRKRMTPQGTKYVSRDIEVGEGNVGLRISGRQPRIERFRDEVERLEEEAAHHRQAA